MYDKKVSLPFKPNRLGFRIIIIYIFFTADCFYTSIVCSQGVNRLQTMNTYNSYFNKLSNAVIFVLEYMMSLCVVQYLKSATHLQEHLGKNVQTEKKDMYHTSFYVVLRKCQGTTKSFYLIQHCTYITHQTRAILWMSEFM